MAYPPKPTIQTSYTAVEQMLGDGSFPGQELDVDLANLKSASDALNDFVRAITRSDGRLANGVVTRDTLAADILLGLAPPVPWQTGAVYAPPATVFESERFYIANTEHTSGVFADDLAAGRWVLLADFTAVQAAAIAAQVAAELARDDAVQARDDIEERYLGSFSAPPTLTPSGNPLTAGMLYFDTVSLAIFVYSGVTWIAASSSIAGVRQVFTYTATAGQTVFTGADDGSEVLVFDNSVLVSVYLNGVRLVDTTDYTADVATDTVTLAAGASLNDIVQIEVFGNFNASPPEGVNVSQITVAGATFTGRASQAEAQAGSDNAKFMTPLRTAEAITAAAPGLTLDPTQLGMTGPGLVGRTGAGAGAAQEVTAVAPITLGSGNASIELAGLTEETSPAAADLLLLEKAADGAKRKVRVDTLAAAPTTSEVLTATAGASAGAVGTYAFLATSNSATSVAFGDTIAGSSLIPAGVRQSGEGGVDMPTSGSAQSGTWRCLGFKPARVVNNSANREATLFLRIS